MLIFKFAAYGAPGAPEQGSLVGTWAGADSANGDGEAIFPDVRGSLPDALPKTYNERPQRTLVTGDLFTHFLCDQTSPAWHAVVSNNIVTGARPQCNLPPTASSSWMRPDVYTFGGMILMRDTRRGGTCDESDSGKGSTVLALERNGQLEEEEIDPSYFRAIIFITPIPILDERMFWAQFAMLIDDCSATNDLTPSQQRLLLNWVARRTRTSTSKIRTDALLRTLYIHPLNLSPPPRAPGGARGGHIRNRRPINAGMARSVPGARYQYGGIRPRPATRPR